MSLAPSLRQWPREYFRDFASMKALDSVFGAGGKLKFKADLCFKVQDIEGPFPLCFFGCERFPN